MISNNRFESPLPSTYVSNRAVARALTGGGGVYIHIFVLCRLISFEINPNSN